MQKQINDFYIFKESINTPNQYVENLWKCTKNKEYETSAMSTSNEDKGHIFNLRLTTKA